jgi:hypothetical protein
MPTTSPLLHTNSDIVENFMSSLIHLIRDPVLSKWIIMVLAISISLDGESLLSWGARALLPREVCGSQVRRWMSLYLSGRRSAGVYYTPPLILKDSSRTPQTPQGLLRLLKDSSTTPPPLLKSPYSVLRYSEDSSRTPQGVYQLQIKDSLGSP